MKPNCKIVQTGTKLRVSGSVETLFDGFYLISATLGKVENGKAIILADVGKRERINIFSSGLIEFDQTFDVPPNLHTVQVVVNGAFDANFDVEQAEPEA